MFYLVKRVVCGDSHGVCVQHQPLSKEGEKTMGVHDFNFSPGEKGGKQNIMKHTGFSSCMTLG